MDDARIQLIGQLFESIVKAGLFFLHNSKNHKEILPFIYKLLTSFFVDRLWRNEEFIHINQVDMVDYWFIVCG